MTTFKQYDKVVRKGTFDGNIGTIKDLTYIEGMAVIRFTGGETCESVSDLVLYNPDVHK